ncbi:hypothetical protein ACIRPQ_28955 [Streptomyces sp. NPDC101213]|uniref:hypothetical protein n=1 Tax=Streptomyces sp. NPDC101213 TaxID=3366130 RepID=UPI0037F9DA77
MAPTTTRFYLDRAQIAQMLGLTDSKSIRQMETSGRMLSPDVIVGDEDTQGKVSYGWDEKRVREFFTARGRLDDQGRPVVGQKPGKPRKGDEDSETEFMARWTSIPKRYLGTRQVCQVVGISDVSLHVRREAGNFPQPDVVIGRAPTALVNGEDVPTTKTARGVVHGWDEQRTRQFGLQEGLITVVDGKELPASALKRRND